MQVTSQQTQTVLNKLTDAQIQQQLQAQQENTRWAQKQQELQNTFNRQEQLQAQAMAREQFLVEHLAGPLIILALIVAVAISTVYLVRRAIAADIEKNRDDNASDVRRAQEILYENKETTA